MKHDFNSLTDNYKNNGFVIVDDFLPEEIANKLEVMYSDDNNEWEYLDQVRDQAYSTGKYGKSFTKSPYFPREEETYTAKFWRSNKLESETENIFGEYFVPALKSISQLELSKFDRRCFKLDEGCHYRTHIDEWLGRMSCSYYINKDWIWDWGGILHICSGEDEDYCKPIFPKFNRLVLLNNKKFHSPHFISPVSEFALNSRFSIVIFSGFSIKLKAASNCSVVRAASFTVFSNFIFNATFKILMSSLEENFL